jgi:CBS domain-containing protein
VLGLVTQRDILAATTPIASTTQSASVLVDDDSIRLSDIMIRNVSVVHQSDSLRQAALYLQEHKYGCLPVVQNERLVGIITDSDFIAIAINLLEQAELLEEGPEVEDVIDDFEILTVDDVR